MQLITSTGIALSSQVYGESDIACNYYTSEFGKRKFVFKGLKKSGKRSRAATEPGSVARVIYYYRDDRDSYIVSQYDIETYHSSISGNLRKIFSLYFMLESVEKTCGYNVADPAIYALLHAALGALADTDYTAHLSLFFLLHLLNSHGVLSDIDSCKSCGSVDYPAFILDTVDSRPVCSSCFSGHYRDAVRRIPALPRTMRECLRIFLSQKFGSITMSDYPEKDVLDTLFNLSLFLEEYFHAELKTKSFIFSDRFR